MKNFLLTFLVFLSFVGLSSACQPCLKNYSFDEAVKKADLIILGQKIKAWSDNPKASPNQPEWVEVAVKEVFKGELSAKQVKIHSYYGMCPYGVVLPDDKSYLMLLEKEDDHFRAVYQGCAVNKYLVEDNKVLFEDEKISIDDFVKKIGQGGKREMVKEDNPLGLLIPLLGGLLVLIGLFYLIWKFENKRRFYEK